MNQIWKKVSKANTVEEFIFEKTGRTIAEITEIKNEYKINRIPELVPFLQKAQREGIVIRIIGDYDADGVTSVLILAFLFQILGIKYSLILPKRMSEGYGLSMKIMERIPDNSMILTVDNGIKAIEPIKYAKQKGMDVLVIDHHQSEKGVLPPADVIIDPSAIGEADYLHYCGAGLSYKIAEYLIPNHPFLPVLASFAAIGTIGDCVELSGDNRRIVTEGMNAIKSGKTTLATQYLCKKSKIDMGSSAMDIAFNVCPALNAPGRLYDDGAKIAVQALYRTMDNNGQTEETINKLLEINEDRKKIVEEIKERLPLEEMKNSSEKSIFLTDNSIPEGIIGIVAGQIAEYTQRPTFVFTENEPGRLKGSVRNPNNDIDIYSIIEANMEYLLGGGGHPKAAGISICPENVAVFKEKVNELLPIPVVEDFLPYDLEVSEKDFLTIGQKIIALEPCGEGMPAPIVRIRVKLTPNKKGETFMLMGEKKNHVKFFCGDFAAVAFNMAEKLGDKKPMFIDMVGRVSLNVYKEKASIQLILKDFNIL